MIITKSHAEEATARPWRIDHNARVEIKQDTDEWSSMIATVYKSGRCNGNEEYAERCKQDKPKGEPERVEWRWL